MMTFSTFKTIIGSLTLRVLALAFLGLMSFSIFSETQNTLQKISESAVRWSLKLWMSGWNWLTMHDNEDRYP